MNRKPGIPLVAIIIFFALIIGIIVTCIIILSTNSGSSSKQTINLSSNSSANTNIDDNAVMQNAIVSDDEEEDDDNGQELELSNSSVAEVFKLAGNQKTFAKYGIYYRGSFDENTISNELKLRMALAQVKDSEIDSENNLKTIPINIVEKYLNEIFGSSDDVSYIDVELYSSDDNFSNNYNVDRYVYDDENEVYEIVESGITENEPPVINELVTKAIKYKDRIELYVVPLFINTFEIDGGDMGYQFYSSYNFSSYEFGSEMQTVDGASFAIASQTYRDNIIDSSSVDGLNYDILAENIMNFDSLQRYKYVFEKDSNSGTYRLVSFGQADEPADYSNGGSQGSNSTDFVEDE